MKLGGLAQGFILADDSARELLLPIDRSWAHMCYTQFATPVAHCYNMVMNY